MEPQQHIWYLSLQGKPCGLGTMFAFGTTLKILCLQNGDTEEEG